MYFGCFVEKSNYNAANLSKSIWKTTTKKTRLMKWKSTSKHKITSDERKMASVASKCSINVSFSGCGFLGMYHIGVLARLKEGQDSNQDPFVIKSALGASAGALGKFFMIFLWLATTFMKETILYNLSNWFLKQWPCWCGCNRHYNNHTFWQLFDGLNL